MRRLAQADEIFERQLWPRDEALRVLRRPRRAAEGAADRGEDRRGRPRSRSTRSRTATRSSTSAVGPHVPSTGKLKAFKLTTTSSAYWKGDAKNQPMQRVYGTAFFSDKDLQAHLARLEEAQEARPPQGGQGTRAVHVPPVGPGRGVLAAQGHGAVQRPGRVHAQGALPGRLRRGEDAHHLQQGAVGDVGALAPLPREHVRARGRRGRGHGAQGHELPRAHARVRQPGAELPRPADPVPRADGAAPQRGVGRARRADARAPVLAGRRALLRDAGADRRRSPAVAGAGAAGVRRPRPDLRGEAVDASREVPRASARRGITPRRS